MINKIKRNIFIIIPIFIISNIFFTSCLTYQELTIDTLIPAKYTFAPELKSAVIVNNSLTYKKTGIHKVKLPHKKYFVDSVWLENFAQIAVNKLKEELQNRNFFDSVYVYPKSLKNNYFSNVLSNRAIQQLCEKYNAEVVIALNDYAYNSFTKIQNLSNEGNVIGTIDLRTKLYWTAHNGLNNKLELNHIQKDTISWFEEDVDIHNLSYKLPKLKECIKNGAEYSSEKATDLFAPHWIKQHRYFYNTGNYSFMQASDYIRVNKWEEAARIWEDIYKTSKNLKNKVKAAHNLTLANEMLSNYPQAFEWLKKSLEIIESSKKGKFFLEEKKSISIYNIILQKRFREYKKLKKQMG